MECSIGFLINDECHKLHYSRKSQMEVCTEEELKLLQMRLDNSVKTACTYHKKKFLDKFTNYFGTSCINTLGRHRKKITSSLR